MSRRSVTTAVTATAACANASSFVAPPPRTPISAACGKCAQDFSVIAGTATPRGRQRRIVFISNDRNYRAAAQKCSAQKLVAAFADKLKPKTYNLQPINFSFEPSIG